jgi:hypothetical protein
MAASSAWSPWYHGAKETQLTQAFRWNGLNLASLDARLGRYFGTSTGVLVISGGPSLPLLEPGDVIQRIDGKAVATPRDVMRLLRAKDTGGQLRVEVLRDRKLRAMDITVPEAPPMNWFAPPALACSSGLPATSAAAPGWPGPPPPSSSSLLPMVRSAQPPSAGVAHRSVRAACSRLPPSGPISSPQ